MIDDFALVPDWQRDWIVRYADDLAGHTCLSVADHLGFPPTVDSAVWEAGGRLIIRDVGDALAEIEDADTIIQAQQLGAATYLRRLHELVSTSAGGGRA